MDTCVVESSPFRKRVSTWGDCVLVVIGKEETKAIRLTENRVDQTRFGALRHNDCYGQTYGSKISTSCGHVHILPFDPVLWSHSLPHRTQIIYPPDASMIVGGLDLVPGKRVLEAGTGSGSLTHFFAQAVWPTGRVLSFEFHLGRVELAAEEFQAHGLSNVVSVSHRDVCADGFPPAGDPSNPDGVDAVSLDLPQPWLVVPSLTMVFRADCDGRVCSFSPCIEQVQLTVSTMKKAGFVHIQTVECLQRNYDVVRAVMNVPNLGQVGAHRRRISNIPLKEADNAADGWWTNRYLLPPPSGTKPVHSGIKRTASVSPLITPDAKLARVDADCMSVETIISGDEANQSGAKSNTSPKPDRRTEQTKRSQPRDGFTWEALPQTVMAGHTGYLTFATWLPNRTQSVDDRHSEEVSGGPGESEPNSIVKRDANGT